MCDDFVYIHNDHRSQSDRPTGVYDPAWWWVKASNLGGLSGPVVQFNLTRETEIYLLCFVLHRSKPIYYCRMAELTQTNKDQRPH